MANNKEDEPMKSMRKCYKTIAISGCFDIATSIGYTWTFIATPDWTSLHNVSIILWKIAFSLGLFQLSEKILPMALKQHKQNDIVAFRATLANACGLMARLWRQSTRVVLGGVVLHLCRLVGVSSSWTPRLASTSWACILVLAIGLAPLQDSKKQTIELHKAGGRWSIINSLTMCTIAVFLQATCTTLLSLLFDKRLTNQSKLFMLPGIHTPFITASLLWKMRGSLQSFLQQVDNSSGKNITKDAEQPFWEAHTKFYTKLQSAIFWEIIFKGLMLLYNLVRTSS